MRTAQSLPKARHIAFAVLCLHFLICAILAGAGNPIVDALSQYILALLICAWIQADAREKQKHLCYDFDTFLFFTWPLLAPIYLFQTRGLRAFITIIVFALLCAAALALTIFLHS